MTHVSYNEALFEEEARVAGVYPIGLIGSPDNPPDWLVEMFEAADRPEHPLFKALPELRHDAEEAADWAMILLISSNTSLIVKYEACVRTYSKPPMTSWVSGWGYYWSGYLVVDGFDEVGPAVLAAVRERHEAERQKAGAE